MSPLGAIVDELQTARAGLLRAADSIGREKWRTSPGAGAWSTAEVIAHLTMVEGTVTSSAGRMLKHPPKLVPFYRRFHLPVGLVKRRTIRLKSPIPLDPALLNEKEQMLTELRKVREGTLALLQENAARNLGVYRWPHPFLGSLNLYQWFVMLANHEIRHTKQIQEIVRIFKK